jgi:release factor glutamine methyltransferase
VTKDTLIPRPETEALINLAKTLNAQKILDVGTGSGCIAITLALEMPQTEIEAVDISPKALEIAQENAKNLGAKVKFYQSDLLENTEKYDVIVANLPYVDKNWDWLGSELDYEPETALYADDGGLELIKKLISQAPQHLNHDGYLLLEADRSQHEKIASYASDHFDILSNPNDQTLALCLCLR